MSTICLDIDLLSVCRICLSQTDMNEHLFNIFSDAIVDGMLVALPDVIEYCVDIQAREIAGVPNKICQSCKSKMFEFYVFKQKCQRTDSVLRSMIEKTAYLESDRIEEILNNTECGNSMYMEMHLTDSEFPPEESTLTTVCPSESMLSINSVVVSVHDEMLADNLTEQSTEHGNPMEDTVVPNCPDNVSCVSASVEEEEYIEELYEEFASSPSVCSTAIDEPESSSPQVHVTITHVSANMSDSFVCEICGLPSASKARLKRHMKLHDESNAVLSQMSFFVCAGCKTMYLSEESLKNHSTNCCELLLNRSDGEKLTAEDSFAEGPERNAARCGVCDTSYSNIVQLKQHILTHMGTFPCPFEGCGCEYASLARLNIHVNSKHVDYFAPTCPHCKEAIDRVDLNQHLRTSCKAKQYKCTHCDKKFLSSRALAQHLKKLEQTFQCAQCDKAYSSRAAYKLHLRTHTGERPFVCRVCNKSYKTASLRTAHMDSHIEGKTFECSICGKFLQTRTCYRNHIKRHLEERSYGCGTCGKKFYTKHSLRVHQETVHKLKRAPAGSGHVVDE